MMKAKRTLSIALALLLSLSACAGAGTTQSATSTSGSNSKGTSTMSTSGSAGKTPVPEGKDTLIQVTVSDPTSFDPYAQNEVVADNVMMQMFEGLVYLDTDGKIQYALAEDIQVENNQKFTVKLKKGVKFHNGEELKASDVVFSLKRSIDSPAVNTYSGDIDPASFEILDDYTLKFALKSANAAFYSNLTHPACYIMNEKAVKEAGDQVGVKPVGTGPFEFVSWTKNEKVVLKRFDGYRGDPAGVAKVEIKTVTEAANRTIEVETGNADIANEIPATDLERVQSNQALQLLRRNQTSVTYLGFNLKSPKLQNVKLREAIAYALDLNTAVQSVYKGLGDVASSVNPPQIKFSKGEAGKPIREYNVEKAKELMKEAGLDGGLELTLKTNSNNAQRMDLATIIQQQLAAIGITVKFEGIEWGTFLDTLKQANSYEMFILGWSTPIMDPDTSLYGLLHGSQSAGGSNYTHFENAEFDKLLTQGRQAGSEDERKQAYQQAEDILSRELPLIPISYPASAFALQGYVQGFEPTSYSYHRLAPVTFGND